VRALLDTEGINLNLAENDGWTPLMFAANNNRAQITRLLIERGADTSLKSRVGFSAMGIARDHNFMDVVALFKSAIAIRRDFLAIPKVVVKVKESNDAAADVQTQQSAAQYNPATQPAGNRATTGKKAADPRPSTGTSATTGAASQQPPKPEEAKEKKKSGWFW
jgi:ankyrin repeat protein